MTVDVLERQARRWTAIAWLIPTALALHGAWRGHQATGRKVGRPFTALPWWLLGAIGSVYLPVMLRLWRPLRVRSAPLVRAVAVICGGLLSAGGLGLVVWGRLALGEMHNVSSALGVQLFTGHRLITTGPYAVVRHPMYLGALIAGLGALLVYRTWTVVFVMAHASVFVVRARREEQALAAEFGQAWSAYAARVPGWIPRRR